MSFGLVRNKNSSINESLLRNLVSWYYSKLKEGFTEEEIRKVLHGYFNNETTEFIIDFANSDSRVKSYLAVLESKKLGIGGYDSNEIKRGNDVIPNKKSDVFVDDVYDISASGTDSYSSYDERDSSKNDLNFKNFNKNEEKNGKVRKNKNLDDNGDFGSDRKEEEASKLKITDFFSYDENSDGEKNNKNNHDKNNINKNQGCTSENISDSSKKNIDMGAVKSNKKHSQNYENSNKINSTHEKKASFWGKFKNKKSGNNRNKKDKRSKLGDVSDSSHKVITGKSNISDKSNINDTIKGNDGIKGSAKEAIIGGNSDFISRDINDRLSSNINEDYRILNRKKKILIRLPFAITVAVLLILWIWITIAHSSAGPYNIRAIQQFKDKFGMVAVITSDWRLLSPQNSSNFLLTKNLTSCNNEFIMCTERQSFNLTNMISLILLTNNKTRRGYSVMNQGDRLFRASGINVTEYIFSYHVGSDKYYEMGDFWKDNYNNSYYCGFSFPASCNMQVNGTSVTKIDLLEFYAFMDSLRPEREPDFA